MHLAGSQNIPATTTPSIQITQRKIPPHRHFRYTQHNIRMPACTHNRASQPTGDSIMQHQHTHQPSASARLLTLILQTISSIIATGVFYIVLFYWYANSGVPLNHISLLDTGDIKFILLFVLSFVGIYAFIPSLLAAITSCYFINHHPPYRISIGAAMIALLCGFVQNLLLTSSPNWMLILLNALAAALSALYFARPKPQTQKH
ncbi:hypothetical protein [Snodgrassella sp. ESL0253]|uniref:hypothetical protein n=1 Tax=Snodgrassella sp. ESL0253 TaxID=2705031 RepID=UPI0015813B66|nr:hypothetical protein [Snodgrassella sp. ESL0253]NUE66607.1 hypothetical protein [Snodgrassella sp. ESL0253]